MQQPDALLKNAKKSQGLKAGHAAEKILRNPKVQDLHDSAKNDKI